MSISAFWSIVTTIILGQYWVAAIVVLMLSGGQVLETICYTGNWKGSMEGWLLTPTTGYQELSICLPGLRQFLMVAWEPIMTGGGLPSGLLTACAAVQAICRHDRRQFVSREPVTMCDAQRGIILTVMALGIGGFAWIATRVWKVARRTFFSNYIERLQWTLEQSARPCLSAQTSRWKRSS